MASQPQDPNVTPEITDDPIFGKYIANYPSDRLRLLVIGGVGYAGITFLMNIVLIPVESAEAVGAVSIIVLAVSALLIAWGILHYWNREVVLYEKGFSYREGSRAAFITYTDIRTVHLKAEQVTYFGGIIRRRVRRYTVRTIHDETILLTHIYRNLETLINRLEALVNVALLPRITAQIADGHAVPFGEGIALLPDGLRVRERVLLWDQYSGYRIGEGQLHLLTTDAEPVSTPLEPIENVTLLLEILRMRKPS